MKVLVTGVAGFIGSHVALYLLARGDNVVGIDNINDYYDVSLKHARLNRIENFAKFQLDEEIYPGVENSSDKRGKFNFIKMDLCDRNSILNLFESELFDQVINLAAQAGVRYSIENPFEYIDSNITGFINILEGCRHNNVKHLVYASSSSVYGGNEKLPFSEHDNVDHPLSLYAATKKSNELMAHTYSNLYNLPTTGLRFFTVYGPWGRPDMALFLFADAILRDKPIKVFNYGKHKRDFTYIDDIVEGVINTLDNVPTSKKNWDKLHPDPASSFAPWRVYNIGNNAPVELMTYINEIEKNLGKKAKKELLPLQPGDVPDTCANIDLLVSDTMYKPKTTVKDGIKNFTAWYKGHFKL